MSKLSALLNPAPTAGSEASPPTNHAPQVQPLVLDGHNHRKSSISYSGSPTHTRHPSITSPGLEALADAASNTAPLASPTQRTGSFAHSTPFQPSYAQYSSRPSSSHTTLPSISNDYAHAQLQHNAPLSSSLEQYHHHTSNERRLSNHTDSAARLPPLQRSPTDKHTNFSSDASVPRPLNGIAEYANGTIPEQQAHSPSGLQGEGAEKGAAENTDVPATSQIRQPSQGPPQPLNAAEFPESQGQQVEVKAEIAENPSDMTKVERCPSGQIQDRTGTPNKSMQSPAPSNGVETKKDADNSGVAPSKPKAPPSKKRAAPKKGTASAVKPATKKRRLDSDNIDGTPSMQRSGTPATSRASNTPVPKSRKQGSITPARSSSLLNGAEDEDGSEEDTEAYCICRKPDDHTLMIGCDGPCEDWFHVRCVSMDSVKAKLISKWYCPNCAEKGLETLWKRMCRLEGCQEPARQDGENRSKYCCDDHGAEFMRVRALNSNADNKGNNRSANKKGRRRDNYTDNHGNADDSPDEDPGHLRGGVLKPSELKAITDGINDIDAFHRLGDGVLSPPPTVSPEGENVKLENEADMKKKPIYTPEESIKLEDISAKREKVRAHKKMLDDRDRFLLLVTARAKTVLAELKEQDKSINTICGYDTRITWSDDEFNEWRASSEGRSALEKGGVLNAPMKKEKPEKVEDDKVSENAAPDAQVNGEEEEEIGKGVCKKKRCERHKAWLKLMQQEILFETHQARQAMKKLEAEEKDVKDRAMIRHLEGQET